jgi:transcriptional regulator with XRE-family HTH domain
MASLTKREKNLDIFDDIRRIRRNRGITLQAMARETGISLNYLSQIERGKTNPSIGIIKKITNILGVPFMGLGNEGLSSRTSFQEVGIVRRNMRKMLIFPKSKLKSYLLTPDLQRKLEVLWSEVKPGEKGEEVWYSHEGEEFGLVLEGQYEVTVEDKTYILNEGDSIYFPSHLAHKMRGVGTKPCRTIWVITPPSF